jgi:hypothetical protein
MTKITAQIGGSWVFCLTRCFAQGDPDRGASVRPKADAPHQACDALRLRAGGQEQFG